MDQHLFTRLLLEKKALWNWRKIMTMIQLVKALGPQSFDQQKENLG